MILIAHANFMGTGLYKTSCMEFSPMSIFGQNFYLMHENFIFMQEIPFHAWKFHFVHGNFHATNFSCMKPFVRVGYVNDRVKPRPIIVIHWEGSNEDKLRRRSAAQIEFIGLPSSLL